MKETDRIVKLFEDLYDGSPWIGVTLLPTLQTLTAKQASKRVNANWNTIWEITHHLISWRDNVLQRLHGKVIKSPAHNYIVPVTDTSPEAWKQMLVRLEKSQAEWVAFLKKYKASEFENVYPVNQMTYYEHIQGILQHDAYHLGQIVILAKNA